ncbi:family 17 putative glycosyltransferase [Cercophora samala]|uniref:Family 17 putative glycosyltransferase n=1 Tax=Cercophora samala TaxID=330535 RepID=A0AA39ZAT6_9PEZI|nr:family 17 putative glycosyltransferase [Cercophora samala]
MNPDDEKRPRSRMALRRSRLWRIIKIVFFFATLHFLYQAFTFYINDDTICSPHGWKPFPRSRSAPPRKVYDLTMINTELDWLEIRLNSTWNEVDYFVVVESPRTFTNLPKPLHLKTALANASSPVTKYKSKIIYHEITYPQDFSPKSTWNVEDFQRNAMLTQVFPSLSGPFTPFPHDVLVISDIDEVPRPSTLSLLRHCSFPRRLTLSSRFYYYSFQYLHIGPEWPHPQATYYQGSNTLLPNDLRIGDGPWWRKYFEMGRLKNAAWHCSSCFETMGEMLTKMRSFSHAGMNQGVFRDRHRMVERVRKGKDLWDREGEEYQRVEGNEDLPGLLKGAEEKRRFGYMLDRDGEGAGFRDWKGE